MANDTEKHPAQWALDLFEPDCTVYNQSILAYFPGLTGAIAGLHAVLFRNKVAKRPWHAHIHITILASAFCAFVAQSGSYMYKVRRVRRDAMLYDYISLHPERFPEPENRKFADILEPWFPVR